jgi:Domain of unknown function (DUF4331)
MKRMTWVAVALLATAGAGLKASSHREAPGIAGSPKLDGTDFYMFRSYEAGRQDFVTLLANYVPLQDAYGGPNFFRLDDNGLYEIKIDNDGDAREDITFQFKVTNTVKNFALPIGGKNIAVPLINIGPIGPGANQTANLNVIESYTLSIIRDHVHPRREAITNAVDGSETFLKPVDRIGDKSFGGNASAYDVYANNHIFPINIPGCASGGRVFVGQRRDGFVVNLAETFDLINTNPLGPVNGAENSLADKNITTLALEVPTSCLVANDPVIGGWTTASKGPDDKGKDDHGKDDRGKGPNGPFTQVSRLGAPLVNEVVIGLKDKDRFNGSDPKDDAQFADYVLYPTLPALIEALFGVSAPTTPRHDLVQVFLTGVPGLNQPAYVTPAEILRLNTTTPVIAPAMQNPLGVIGNDLSGYPNGRRPGDDVVDIALRAVEGILLSPNPAAFPKFTDGAFISATVGYSPEGGLSSLPVNRLFRDTFPYLQGPISGSPTPSHR